MRLSLVAVITIAFSLFFIPFNTYSEVTVDHYSLESHIESIFQTRSDIWNSFVLGGYESMELLESDLKQNTIEPLLKSDLEIYSYIRYNPTSYELIEDVKVESLEITNVQKEKIKANVELRWTVQDIMQTYTENVRYTVYLEKINNNWMLSNYITQN